MHNGLRAELVTKKNERKNCNSVLRTYAHMYNVHYILYIF